MGKPLVNLSYDDWVELVFAHGVPFQQPAWYHRDDADWWEPRPAQAVEYVARLF